MIFQNDFIWSVQHLRYWLKAIRKNGLHWLVNFPGISQKVWVHMRYHATYEFSVSHCYSYESKKIVKIYAFHFSYLMNWRLFLRLLSYLSWFRAFINIIITIINNFSEYVNLVKSFTTVSFMKIILITHCFNCY